MTALRDFRLLTPDRDIRKSRYQTFHSSTAGAGSAVLKATQAAVLAAR
jgi:hypothetical protein